MGRSGCRGVGLLAALGAGIQHDVRSGCTIFSAEFVPLTSLSRGDIIFSALDFLPLQQW